jgi:iron complex transport system substrate-binding protein
MTNRKKGLAILAVLAMALVMLAGAPSLAAGADQQAADAVAILGTKGSWYDHAVSVSTPALAEAAPVDGEYLARATLSGGSGKATVDSLLPITVIEGAITARVTWSSSNYDLMIVGGAEYRPINTEGNSVFEIPVALGEDIAIQAETVAMSTPKMIDYVLRVELIEYGEPDSEGTTQESEEPDEAAEAESPAASTTTLKYAAGFTVAYLDNGCKLITVNGVGQYLVASENADAPDIPGVSVLRQPIDAIYLAATSAMCLFDALDGLDSVKLSGTKADGWYNANARAAMESGAIVYAGKYSALDYETITAGGCKLAIESNMISHAPDVKEKLEALGIPVLVDISSYEAHPLGRTEWMKLYAALLDKEDAAARLFDEQEALMSAALNGADAGKSATFFYVSAGGSIVTRKSGDYVAKMIALAGGRYIFDDLGDDTKTGTVTLDPEAFYAAAKDADVIIYNAAIAGEVHTIDELVSKLPLLRDFKAVWSGDVWCTDRDMYQETTQVGKMIAEFADVFEGEDDNLDFLFKLT